MKIDSQTDRVKNNPKLGAHRENTTEVLTADECADDFNHQLPRELLQQTEFSKERLDLHKRMAFAYQGFLKYLFVENKEDDALHRSMNEVRIKFLSLYFATHAPVAPFFAEKPNLSRMKSLSRRYIIADYFSKDALIKLKNFPGPRMGLKFEHIVPKDRLKQEFETKVRSGKELLSVHEIARKLDQTWHIAVVTDDEDRKLFPQKGMPKWWSHGKDIFARYRESEGGLLRFEIYRANEEADICRNILHSS